MREKLKITTLKNPRKPNGDLGDWKCFYCGCQTGAYVLLDFDERVCKGRYIQVYVKENLHCGWV